MSQYQLTAVMPMTTETQRSETSRATGMSEEAVLFARFLGGDDIAAIKVFKRYNDRLFIYCAKVLGDRDQAKDLTGELWERVIRLRRDPPEVLNPAGFLFRIARNLCLNHFRLKKETTPLSEVDESLHPSVSIDGRSELEEVVLASLDDLSFDYREVLVLNIYCGYRLDEIAAMLGKTPEAIWARASRARIRLRKVVRAMLDEDKNAGDTNGVDEE